MPFTQIGVKGTPPPLHAFELAECSVVLLGSEDPAAKKKDNQGW